MNNLDALGGEIMARLEEKHDRREELLDMSRHLIHASARAIRAIHRGEPNEVAQLLDEAGAILAEMQRTVGDHADLESAGYTLDAQKEYAEARLTAALVAGDDLVGPPELGVDDAAWLNGLGEAAGELRRAVLDRIRRGDFDGAEALLERMEEIHAFLSTVDFPAAITRNIKRTNDMVRGVTERTRGDLTIVIRQEALRRALERAEARFGELA